MKYTTIVDPCKLLQWSLNKVRKLTFGFVANDFFLFLVSELLKDDFAVLHEFDRTPCGSGGGLFDPELGREHNFACKIQTAIAVHTHMSSKFEFT